ncbi:MAG: type II secretion system F family protein [Planctomycetota bacterium]
MFWIAVALLVLILYSYLGWKLPAIALVTSPFVAGTLLIIGAAEDDPAVMTLAGLIFPATLIAILISKPDRDSERWPQTCAKWILIIFVFLLALATMGVVFRPLIIVPIAFVVLFIGSIISYALTSRHATAAYVISTIGASMRQNLPLAMALESAAGGLEDKRSRILNAINRWLVQGYSLSESIKFGYPGCPGYAVAMITAAERIGQLPFAIKAIETDMVTKADERRKIRPIHPIYPVILMVIIFLILAAVMTFVMPQLESALLEMTGRAALPFSTRLLMGIGHEYGWLIGLGLVLIVLVGVPAVIYAKFRPRRPNESYLLSRIGDFVKWHLPILHHFERNYSMVQVVELLRLSLNAGGTVNGAIDNAIELDVNNCFKKRLRRWLKKVERGDNIAAAARKSKLGSPLAWAFDEKVNPGNTLAVLETLENFYRSSYSYRVNLARFIMWPCLTLVMGAIVGFVVYAIFSPLVAIITSLTGQVMP